MKMIKLRNKKRASLVYTLTHDTWCVGIKEYQGSKKCACTTGAVKIWESKDAAGFKVAAVKSQKMKYGPVLTLQPLERMMVPDVVLKDPTIQRDITKNILQNLGEVAKAPQGKKSGTGPVRESASQESGTSKN